ncbi:MAG: hypothetical protein WC700_04065 [Gemmatimonadaceae bacterium]|jgi:hypothetical protein
MDAQSLVANLSEGTPNEFARTYQQNPDDSVEALVLAMIGSLKHDDRHYQAAAKPLRGWDPAASAEAEALATVGSLQHDKGKLPRAINSAYANTSNWRLETVMRQKGPS